MSPPPQQADRLPDSSTSASSSSSSSSSSLAATDRKAAEKQELEGLLLTAFGPSSVEKQAWDELSNDLLSPETTTARTIGLAAAFGGASRFFADDRGLLGGGWHPWMVKPRRDDGGQDVLHCCVRNSHDEILTFVSRARSSLADGHYSLAKEVARRSLVSALVRSGLLDPQAFLRRRASTSDAFERDATTHRASMLSRSESESGPNQPSNIFVDPLPHLDDITLLSPSIVKAPSTDSTSLSAPDPLCFATSGTPTSHPPYTPTDSPFASPRSLGYLSGFPKLEFEPSHFGVDFEEPEEGLRTPTGRETPLHA